MLIDVSYTYDLIFYRPRSRSSSSLVSFPAWRNYGQQTAEGDNIQIGVRNAKFSFIRTWVVDISNPFELSGRRLGGWSLDVHHGYDPLARTLFTGDGRQTAVSGGDMILEALPEWGSGANRGIAVAGDGTVYYARNNAVGKMTPEGDIISVAGSSSGGYERLGSGNN